MYILDKSCVKWAFVFVDDLVLIRKCKHGTSEFMSSLQVQHHTGHPDPMGYDHVAAAAPQCDCDHVSFVIARLQKLAVKLIRASKS